MVQEGNEVTHGPSCPLAVLGYDYDYDGYVVMMMMMIMMIVMMMIR